MSKQFMMVIFVHAAPSAPFKWILGVSLFVGFHARLHASSERERSFGHNKKARHACYRPFNLHPKIRCLKTQYIIYYVQ